MIRISIARPLALSLVLGLSVAGLASAAHAGVTYDYETDVAPHLQTPHAVPGQMQEARAQSASTVAWGGSSAAPSQATGAFTPTNELGQRVDAIGTPFLQDRGMDN